MRTDHLAYQQASRVSFFGLLLQIGLGLAALLYGRTAGDTALVVGAQWILLGAIPWMALILTYQQHTAERIESLELESGAADGQSTDLGARVAANRLRWIHGWFVPAVSVLFAVTLFWMAWRLFEWFGEQSNLQSSTDGFQINSSAGWELAVTAGGALVSFIFSRFIAGMAKQAAWQNLRGGAGIMVGNALVLLAIGVGNVFHLFQTPGVLEGVTKGIGVFMVLVGAETLLNLALNVYRPRRAHETPRPAFDSKILGLLATPDSLVRSINEAVNYQFGFDITSSWGYQLLLRSVAWLGAVGVGMLILMSCIVVVGPGEQAVRQRGSQSVGAVAQGELLFKLPWPLETVEIWPVNRIHSIDLGPKTKAGGDVQLWSDDDSGVDQDRSPFLVAASVVVGQGSGSADASAEGFSLVDADIKLEWRVKQDGLLAFLSFCNDVRSRRSSLDMRERALRALALRETTQFLSTQRLDAVLSPQGDSIVRTLRDRIQASFDASKTGVEVVSVLIPKMRPPNGAMNMFEELSIDSQNARKMKEEAARTASVSMSVIIGSEEQAGIAIAAIELLRKTEEEFGIASPEAMKQRSAIETILLQHPAQAASVIARARARGWELLMDARANAAEVAGQSAAWAAAPALYRERRVMEVLARQLAGVRVKYLIGTKPENTSIDVDMQQPESGLNLGDYLSKDGEKSGG
ncbi:MAG: hypothetical protein O2800_05115 [Planctomycetota bacterium]|nr:hypothetical protein [Planctomycetota bacterium]